MPTTWGGLSPETPTHTSGLVRSGNTLGLWKATPPQLLWQNRKRRLYML